MITTNASEAAKAVVRRNTEEVQGGGNFAVFDELFADDFLDHTPQPGRTPTRPARESSKRSSVPLCPTSTPKSTGSWPMVTG